MNKIESIDLMLKDDAENNPGGKGFVSPEKLFDKIGVPCEMQSYLLKEVVELGLFEYNNPRTGIRATCTARKIYREGGYKKHKEEESEKDILRERAEKSEFRKSIFDYRQRWFTHPLIVGFVCALLGYILGSLS